MSSTLAKKRKIEIPKLHYHVGFIGSGNMARALVEGITTTGNATCVCVGGESSLYLSNPLSCL